MKDYQNITKMLKRSGFPSIFVYYINKYPPVKRGGISFSGIALTVTGDAGVRFD